MAVGAGQANGGLLAAETREPVAVSEIPLVGGGRRAEVIDRRGVEADRRTLHRRSAGRWPVAARLAGQRHAERPCRRRAGIPGLRRQLDQLSASVRVDSLYRRVGPPRENPERSARARLQRRVRAGVGARGGRGRIQEAACGGRLSGARTVDRGVAEGVEQRGQRGGRRWRSCRRSRASGAAGRDRGWSTGRVCPRGSADRACPSGRARTRPRRARWTGRRSGAPPAARSRSHRRDRRRRPGRPRVNTAEPSIASVVPSEFWVVLIGEERIVGVPVSPAGTATTSIFDGAVAVCSSSRTVRLPSAAVDIPAGP